MNEEVSGPNRVNEWPGIRGASEQVQGAPTGWSKALYYPRHSATFPIGAFCGLPAQDRGCRFCSPKILTDGSPPRFLGWVPYSGIRHPPFFLPPFDHGNIVGHAPGGPGPPSLLCATVRRKRSIKPGIPFGKGTGCFSRRGFQQSCLGFTEGKWVGEWIRMPFRITG